MTSARCVFCHEPLPTTYLSNGWGERFCRYHEDEFETCAFCFRLIPEPDRGFWHPDNYPRCQLCDDMGIEAGGFARDVVGDMIDWVRNEGLTLTQPVQFSVRLVGRSDLHRAGRPPTTITRGIASVTRTNGTNAPVYLDIRLLNGMPSPLFEGVTVHELGHAWLACRHIATLGKLEEEGFCELLAYRYYTYLGSRDADYHATLIETNTDPVYGNGFRRLRFLERRVGFDRIVSNLITTGNLPVA